MSPDELENLGKELDSEGRRLYKEVGQVDVVNNIKPRLCIESRWYNSWSSTNERNKSR